MTPDSEAEKAADNWEYENFDWRDHQELPQKKLEVLRNETIPNAFKAGQRFERERWRPKVMALVQRLIQDGDHSELVEDLYELTEQTFQRSKQNEDV